jgi:hypothetical protein
MAGVRGKSGGWNRKSVAEHLAKGTFRPSIHGPRLAAATAANPVEVVSSADRARVVAGLSVDARRIVERLLDEHGPEHAADLPTLHSYGCSLDRLAALQADPEIDPVRIHREVRCQLLLLAALNLPRTK